MLILDYPYVSKILEDTAVDSQIPVLKNELTAEMKLEERLNLVEKADFLKLINENGNCPLYSNSENSLAWISENLNFTGLPEKIELFKNKIRFRELLERIYPELYFKGVEFEKLEEIRVEEIEKPFIIKPAVGFFSLGVHKVTTDEEWTSVLEIIKSEAEEIRKLYPSQVVNVNKFIIEGNIEGEEFAVDAYFNSKGKPVVLNIFKHIFSSENDVSDRVYYTSKKIIETYREAIEDLLKEIGKLVKLQNFPLHIELRIGEDRRIQPIEINPMRFAGLCTTDIAYFAYGINTYRYFLEQLEPDWEDILADKEGKNFCLIMLNKPDGLNLNEIKTFNYEKLLSDFEKPLEIRQMDHEKFGFFGYMFVETRDSSWNEIEQILKSDLMEYVSFKGTGIDPVLKE